MINNAGTTGSFRIPSATGAEGAGPAANGARTTVIAVANQKGGVAKTSTVVSLGGALVETGYEVLLVDLDPQANLTLALGSDPFEIRGSIADVLLNSQTLAAVSRETAIPGLDLVPSNREVETAERFLPVRQDYERLLANVLAAASTDSPGRQTGREDYQLAGYDFVILDCPPALGAITLNALAAAHMLIIPTQPEYFSAHALRSMMIGIRRVRQFVNPRLIYRILITMQDRRNRIHRHLTEQIRLTFGDGLFNTPIQVDTQLRECSVVGLPITHYKPRSRSAEQYRALAQELLQHVQRKVPQPA